MAPKISVIIPVYNVEDYLEACLLSVIDQTFTNLEIIIINDGSTDQSGVICDRFKETDSRIIVCHKVNEGLSVARNIGIGMATGELISFIDSDDTIRVDMFEILYNQMLEHNADLVFCDYYRKGKKIETTYRNDERIEARSFSGDQLLEMLFEQEYCILLPVAWNKLYKRDLFDSIRYPVGRYHEDEYVIHRILSKVKKAIYINQKLYGYQVREKSIVSIGNNKMKNDKLDALQDRLVFLKDSVCKKLYIIAVRFYIKEIIWECMKIEDIHENRQFIMQQSVRLKTVLKEEKSIGLLNRIKGRLFANFSFQYIVVKKKIGNIR